MDLLHLPTGGVDDTDESLSIFGRVGFFGRVLRKASGSLGDCPPTVTDGSLRVGPRPHWGGRKSGWQLAFPSLGRTGMREYHETFGTAPHPTRRSLCFLRTSSAAVPHYFRTTSVLLPHYHTARHGSCVSIVFCHCVADVAVCGVGGDVVVGRC